jgi:hypothetical protein
MLRVRLKLGGQPNNIDVSEEKEKRVVWKEQIL